MRVGLIRTSLWVLVLALLLGCAIFGYLVYQINTPVTLLETGDWPIILTIPSGSTLAEASQLLEDADLVSNGFLFAGYVRLFRSQETIKAGEYEFGAPSSIAAIANKLIRGEVLYHRVTVPEGLTLHEIIALMVSKGFGTQDRFLKLVQSPELILPLDGSAQTLEGYLFPETYLFRRDTTEEKIVEALVKNFKRIWTPEYAGRAAELDLTIREVLTLASLIEKETARPEERPVVSAVFHNRLRFDMKLECDPTVIYAVQLVKEYDGIIHRSDLEIDSPYNTYRYKGLPPGPIANPGRDSIHAALYPAGQDFLFFVSKNDGSHHFSTSYQEHARAVNRFQR